ncbi:MAG TPA: M1 family aminopeptidase [Chitinophagaceae bacterium]|nr:M1 family aminopeptidase [Chitinophagaceae bacterium]
MKLLAVVIFITLSIGRTIAQQPALPQIAAREKKIAAWQLDQQQTSIASNNYRVHYYECTWQIDPAAYYITGKVTAHFNITQSTNNIVFDLTHQLSVDSVLMNHQKITFLQSPGESLAINLPTTFNQGDSSAVTIFYHGAPPMENEAFVQSSHNGSPITWTLSEPYGAKDWWPCRNGLDDKADSIDIYIIHPSQYKATSNGLLQSETTVNNTTTTFYKHRYPIASYLVAFAVSNYSVFTQQVQLGDASLPLIMYVYPESLQTFQQSAYTVASSLKVYYTCYGAYPFMNEKYGETQFGFGGGMEHQTNSFVVSDNPNLTGHELAHQWFGDKITCGSWHDIWLNEGFAEYSADILLSEKTDTSYYRKYVQYDLEHIVTAPGGSVWVDDTTDVNRIFDERLTYLKGAFLLRMLRWTLGDSAFFNGIRNYLNDPKLRYSFARVDDFKTHLEETGHTDLSYFFNQWYYGQGYPSFKVSWQQNINNYATININQVTSDTSVKFFKVPLALTFKNATQAKTFVVTDSINNQAEVFDVGFAADTILIDPDMQLISKDNSSIKLPPATTAVNEITVYPNPFKEQLRVNIKNPVVQQWQAQLFNAGGKRFLSQTFIIGGADAVLHIPVQLNLAAGIYFLKIDGGDTHLVKKLVKI